MAQSERADGRIGDLRSDVLERLRTHTELTDLLEQVDGVTDASAAELPDMVIMPAFLPSLMADTTDLPDPPDVAVAVSLVTGSSARENAQERKSHTVQADSQLRPETLREQGLAWHDEVLDEISAVLTSHVGPWIAQGETGGTPEPLWDDDKNRYRSVQRFDIEHWG